MMEQLRQRLKTWLNGPLPNQPTALPNQPTAISLLQDRMDFLEKRLSQLSVPSKPEALSGRMDDRALSAVPDVHLGAH